MNNHHWLLLGLWITYCFIHSLLAGNYVKSIIQKFMGTYFKYYRPLYSIFAFVTLAFILVYQFTRRSLLLYQPMIFLYFTAIIMALAGSTVMVICINKYFYELSGLQAIQKAQTKNTLQQAGLHKYVRHPLYLGTLLFIWGLFIIFPLVSNLIAATVITIYTLLGIRLEERKLKSEFGESYAEYAKKVPKLIPAFKM